MIVSNVTVNGTEFRVTLTDQTIMQVNSLKKLYDTTYEDPESFDQVGYQISNSINEIATAAEPRASDADLDGLIQEIIKMVESKAVAIGRMTAGTEKRRSRSKKRLA